MSDVTINYKGSSIATMDASGTKTLLTEGKYCEDDIEVVYVSPGGGGYALEDVLCVGASGATGDVVFTGTALPPFAFINNTGLTGFTANNLQYLFGTNVNNAPYRSAISQIPATTFYGCANLKKVSIPNLKTLAYCDKAFRDCSALETWDIPFKSFPSIGAGTFYKCTHLPSLVLPALNDPFYADTFYNCSDLHYIDCGGALTQNRVINANSFLNATGLSVLVFRSTSYLFTLSNINAFSGTPFASNGTGGVLYVPNDLIASYQAASNWSTILGYANNQIKSIESTHTDPNAPIDLTLYYADGTTIPT